MHGEGRGKEELRKEGGEGIDGEKQEGEGKGSERWGRKRDGSEKVRGEITLKQGKRDKAINRYMQQRIT